MKKIKVGYFADGEWAHNTFKLLNNDPNIEIKFVCIRYDSQDDILYDLVKSENIVILKHKNINSNEFIKKVEKYGCDLFVSMSFDQIFKKDIINLPPLGIINSHAGKLPFYRGRNVLNWVLINDEKEFGITVHYVDEGIDTGDIIKQETFAITDDDTYQSLLDIAFVECAKILHESIKLIQNNNNNKIKQSMIHPVGFYCGKRQEGDEIIDWNKTSREIFNFVRAISKPGPQARTKLQGEEVKINVVKLIEDAISYIGIPGQVVGKYDKMPIVKTKDSSLLIKEYQCNKTIKVGDRLL